MFIHHRREQEQIQHMEDEVDTGFSGDYQSDSGDYQDDSDYQGDSAGYDTGNTGYQALCDYHNWKGPCRQTYEDAYADADAHNSARHDGEVGAAVLGPGACF
jgi:hypothetical protein